MAPGIPRGAASRGIVQVAKAAGHTSLPGMSLALKLLSVNAGRPAYLGEWQGEPVISSIAKAPVADATIGVGVLNIEGDEQADLTVHGGADKAVYAYPADHWPWWKAQAGFETRAASFGENLTVYGADEDVVRIGDEFKWGDVLLQVSEPRAPCFKFMMYSGRADLAARMTVSARTGWYFRVLETGRAPTHGALSRTATDAAMPSVREAFIARLHPRQPRELIERVIAAPALARSWRAGLMRNLRALGND